MGSRGAVGAIVALLVLGLTFRLIIAYLLLPGSGFATDLQAFALWAKDLAATGPGHIYRPGFFVDYTPGYLYVLWLLGVVGGAIGDVAGLIKLPAIIADVVLAFVAYQMTLELLGRSRLALLAAALILFNPVTWFESAVWGQVDAVGTIVLLLAVRELWKGRSESATVLATIAAIVKPQYGILLPIVAVVLIRRHLVGPSPLARIELGWDREGGRSAGRGSGTSTIAGAWSSLRSWFAREHGPIRLVTSVVVGLVTAVVVCLPFGLSIGQLAERIIRTAGQYHYVTVNAYNPWALFTLAGSGLAENGLWIDDAPVPSAPGEYLAFGPVPAIVVGTVLLLVAIGLVCAVVARRDDRRTVLMGLAVMAIAFFIVPTRVHERYLFPFFALGAVLAAGYLRWRIAYIVLAVANFLNLYAILTNGRYGTAATRDWLAIGPLIRSPASVTLIVLVNLVAFGWAVGQLLRRGLAQAEELVSEAARADLQADPGITPGPPGVSERDAVQSPGVIRWSEGGTSAPAAGRSGALLALEPDVPAPPAVRPGRGGWTDGDAMPGYGGDRSARLAGERGGRLDRLDLWLLVILVVASLCLRTFRLGEPRDMHFDEVYHARTATEFLQHWRYGEPHSIYEYTHPHLAKYLIALGLVVFGDDKVVSESRVGAPVVGAVIEPRWDDPDDPDDPSDPALPGGRAGDRLYLVTGSELQVYDLADRALVASVPIEGASAVTLDDAAHRLYVGTSDGTVVAFDTSDFDAIRAAGGPFDSQPEQLGRIEGGVASLFIPSAGNALLALTPDGDLVAIDAADGRELARRSLDAPFEMADGGSARAIVAEPAEVTDPVAAAAELARLLGGEASEYEAKLRGATGPVMVLIDPDEAQRGAIDKAVADGTLPGVSISSMPRVAVTTAQGVEFVAPETLEQLDLVATDAPARGLVRTSGPETPRLYVATGESVTVIKIAEGDKAGPPTVYETIAMPGAVERVTLDEASELVHVLGQRPDGSGYTIYVIEPHGNAVFADAQIPFEPSAWATDVAALYPSTDRQELLVFAADGRAAAVSIGQHAFAWRMPGVVAGALTAALLYLLARILFRRRSIALLMGFFMLVDGMFFVQSRIAMNDVYVELFLAAAVTVFAAVWTGWWRSNRAFWVAMPMIGVLLGLALASKWVAAYAIGMCAILVLARSALGRVLLVLGLAAATAALGYLAIADVSNQAKTSGPNYLFFGIMLGLTLVAVVYSVVRPVAWTREEGRFAVAAPIILGALVGLASFVTDSPVLRVGALGLPLVAGVGVGLVGVGLAAAIAFWAAAKVGFGPWARGAGWSSDRAVDARVSAAPPGWLRLGSGFGLPAAWMAGSLLVLPIAVYMITYLPWINLGNHFLSVPPGGTGQTLLDLTGQMYAYHNDLRAGHPASSPWWAWPLNLKPVWFYQAGFAGNTSAAIYDSGNLALWWVSIPAVLFSAWQAIRRRSLALGFIVIALLCMWLPWARIDRATFQYHYYTTLPFVLLALAYLVAEIWNGPSARTWLFARVAAAVAIMAPAVIWLLRAPLCGFVGVESVVKDSQACVNTAGQFVLTGQVAGALVIAVATVVAVAWQLVALDRAARLGRARRGSVVAVVLTVALGVVALFVATQALGPQPVFTVKRLPAEIVAIALSVPLLGLAALALTARNPRRFVYGFLLAALLVFLVFYPNISALPLPSGIFQAYQGLLPTWLYPFQFPVNTDAPAHVTLVSPLPILLFGAVLITCAVVAYAAWDWRSGQDDLDDDSGQDDWSAARA